MVKECCILFKSIFRIKLIIVGALTIQIHILKKVGNLLCLLIFPNNEKQKMNKVKNVVYLIHLIFDRYMG